MKKSLILYDDQLNMLEHLTDEQAGQLFKAISHYHKALKTEKNQTVELGLNGLMLAVFNPFKSQLDRDFESYLKKCETNKENGKKGGRPKKEDIENPSVADNELEIPDNINRQSLNEWFAYKKMHDLTERKKVIEFLSTYTQEEQKQIVDTSIMNSYKGLFHINNKNQGVSAPKHDLRKFGL